MSEWNQTPRSFFHVFLDSRFSSFFSSDSCFSQVCGSRLRARYHLLPSLPIYLASSLPNPTTRTQLLIKTIPTSEEPDSGAPTASNRRCNSLASSLPIQPQIGGTPTSNPARWHFFSSNPTQQRHPQSSGSLST